MREGLGFAVLPSSSGELLSAGVTYRPLDCNPLPTVSVLVAWKSGSESRLVRELVDLARRASSAPQDAPRPKQRRPKS